jgi:tryptophan synthase alpha chain
MASTLPNHPIDALFQRLRIQRQTAFIPFLTAGDPDLAFTATALSVLVTAGADLIEIGFPFSDPIADGPVIQASYSRALSRNLKLPQLLESLSATLTAPSWQTPVVGMVSYSLIYRRGISWFVSAACHAGLHGLIVPDLPVEEADELAAVCRDHQCKLILLVAPTTTGARAERIVRLCSGFVYVVSVMGTTGTRACIAAGVRELLGRLRQLTDLPLCVGFGVSQPEHVAELAGLADGVIVGSALVQQLAHARQDRSAALESLATTVRHLRRPLHSAPH